MEKWWDRVYVGDCIELLETWPDDRTVDLIFADPPYNIGYEYDLYDDRRPDEEYLDWLRKWIAACTRVLSPHGSFWIAIGDEYAGEVKWIAQREIGLHLRNWVIWYYTFGVHCTRKFARSHTHLLYFVRDPKNFTFNSEAIRVPSARRTVYRDRRADPRGRVPDNTWILRPQDAFWAFDPAEDTWYVSRVAGTFRERARFHGCQLPERLVARAVLACSNPNDIVLDPFLGSGTTAVVAKKLGRRWVGIELSEEYARQAEKRIGNVRPGDPLDGPEDPLLPVRRHLSYALPAPLDFEQSHAIEIARRVLVEHPASGLEEILIDPVRNLKFIDQCVVEGLDGRPADWCRGVLGAVLDRMPADEKIWELFPDEPVAHACDMAAGRILHQGYPDLATILCDPRLVLLYYQSARDLCPRQPLAQYRRQLFRLVQLGAYLRATFVPPINGTPTRSWSRAISLQVPRIEQVPVSCGLFRLVLRNERRRELVFYAGLARDLRESYAYWAERASDLLPWLPWPGSLEWECVPVESGLAEQRRQTTQILLQERPFVSGLALELARPHQMPAPFGVQQGSGVR